MAHRPRGGGPRDEDVNGDRSDRERERRREHEPFDDAREHSRIERRRFEGGLPATPELYARAREQWYRLPGAVVRPSMNSGVSDPFSGEPQSPEKAGPTGNGPKQ
jgi:hypothetical protein